MTAAIRTVSETVDLHVIEGLLAFGKRDTYGTVFSARTDWGLDLHPQGIPVLFNHGFDDDFGLAPIGMTSPTASFRTDADGIWVEMQLDKRHKYYATRVRPLLEAEGVGLSQGSAEHSVRVDAKSGEVMTWPLHEISLTPTESNPWNIVAARSAETIRIVEAFRKEVDPAAGDVADEPVQAGVRGIQTFDDIVAAAEISEELPELFDTLTSAIYSAIYAMDKDWNPVPMDEKRTAIQTSLDQFRDHVLACVDKAPARSGEMFRSAIRAGKRNAATDQAGIDLIHDTSVALGTTSHLGGDPGDETPPAEASDDAARSGDTVRITQPEDPAAVRAALLAKADEVGLRVVKERLGS